MLHDLACVPTGGILPGMAQSNERIEELVRELAQLDATDQAKVFAGAARLRKASEKARKLYVPVLRGGCAWVGGDLKRESLYSDDGR